MSRFWSPKIRDIEPYVPGEQPRIADLLKLNTNENPYGPSEKVLAAIDAAADDRLRLYPDPESMALRRAVSDYHGLNTDQVFPGNGSDEVLAHIFMAFFRQSKPLLFPDITYSFYKVYCGLYGVKYETMPLADDFSIRLQDYPSENGGIIFANPNAPTGRLLPLSDIEALLKRNRDSVVVVDEAYVDFGGDSAVSLIDRYDNLLVTQTLSKSRSLAGLRIGLAFGHPELIEGLKRVKDSFNSYPLDRIAEAAAVASYADEDWFRHTTNLIMEARGDLRAALELMGFEVLPSAANFLFARHPDHSGESLAAALRERGIIVRHFQRPERLADWLRITVGTPEQHERLLGALRGLV